MALTIRLQLSRLVFGIVEVALAEMVLKFVAVDCGLLFQSFMLVIPAEFSSTKKENFGGGGEGDDNVGISRIFVLEPFAVVVTGVVLSVPSGINICRGCCFDSDKEE